MRRNIVTTADGSKTIRIPDWDEAYHSMHGAVQEAYHVFIAQGLQLFRDREINILEIGFGTGLNALITLLEAPKQQLGIAYTGVEAFPVSLGEVQELNYCQRLGAVELEEEFLAMHRAPWDQRVAIRPGFALTKQKKEFQQIGDLDRYHLIYYDAFGARVQPELWTEDLFLTMYRALKEGGVLVTYAAKGSVRRAMQEVGFIVERLPGPPGKREMLRATRPGPEVPAPPFPKIP